MANPLDTLTKPLQIGARIAFGAVQAAQQAVQGLTGGAQDEPQQEQPQREEQPSETASRPRTPAQPQRRNTTPKPLDDKTITDKVETELFRDSSVDKGKIDVNTADGVVWLRGQAKTPEQIKGLEAKAMAIPEVKQVENLLHLPKTPAPTRADTPRPQQKTRRHKGNAAARKVSPARTTSERKSTSASAEPSPKELAKKHEGRKPAPLGSGGSTKSAGSSKPSKKASSSKAGGSSAKSTSSSAEPAPKEIAGSGEGRKPAPLGSSEPSGGGGESKPAGDARSNGSGS